MSDENVVGNLFPHMWWRIAGIIVSVVATYFMFNSQSIVLEQKGIKFGAVIIDTFKYVLAFGILNTIYCSFQFGKTGSVVSAKGVFVTIGIIYGLLTGVVVGLCYGLIKSVLPLLFSSGVTIFIYLAFAYPNPILVAFLKTQQTYQKEKSPLPPGQSEQSEQTFKVPWHLLGFIVVIVALAIAVSFGR